MYDAGCKILELIPQKIELGRSTATLHMPFIANVDPTSTCPKCKSHPCRFLERQPSIHQNWWKCPLPPFPHKCKTCCTDDHAIWSLKLSINTKAKAVPKLLGFDWCWKEPGEEFGWDYLLGNRGEFRGIKSMSIYIYIYDGTPPPRPILSQNLLVFALFCCFLLCLNVCFFFLASILYFQKVV